MDRVHVVSKNLESVGYDPLSLTLEVRFLDGSVYAYKNVPEALFKALMAAPHKGEFFRENIRGNKKYPADKLRQR